MKNGKIIFLEVPPSLGDEIKTLSMENGEKYGSFAIDPSIPLPVELGEDGEITDLKNLSENLTWEMIISGMIQVIAREKKSSGAEPSFEGVQPHWINYYRQFVLILKPEIYNEFTGAAIVKTRNRDFGAAIEIIESLEGLFPFSAEVLMNRAFIHEEEGAELERKGCEIEASLENEKAMDTYLKALEIEPKPDIYFNLGFLFTRQKNFYNAREYFTEYILKSDDPEKKTKAENIINEIESSGLDDTRYSKSLELIRQGKEEEALLNIRDFIEEHPGVWYGWYLLGWALRKLRRWNDALGSLKKALELGGTSADTRNETAICLMELGDLHGAKKELEAALREEPENVKIISNLGILAMKNGDVNEAAGFFRIILELNPHDPLALKFFADSAIV